MKNLVSEVATWPPEEQPGEAELRALLDERWTARTMEVLRQAQLRELSKYVQARDAS